MTKGGGDDASSVYSGVSAGGGLDSSAFGSNASVPKSELFRYQSSIDTFVFGLSWFLSKENIKTFHYAVFTIVAEFLRKFWRICSFFTL